MLSFDVLGIGPAFVDLFINVEDGFLDEIGLAKATCRRIDYNEVKRLLSEHKPFRTASGGCAPNTLASLASLGAKTAWIYKLADDELGRGVIEEMQSLGVYYNTPFATMDEGTGSCIIFLTPDGERSMCAYFGAQKEFSVKDIDEEMIKSSKIMYVVGCECDDRTDEALRKAFETSKKADTISCLNTFDARVIENSRANFTNLLKEGLVDIFIGNEQEMKAYYKTDDDKELFELLKGQNYITAITRGKDGAVVIKDKEVITVPCRLVEKAVDTTGAGDAFAAGFLYGFVNGYSMEKCAYIGNEVAREAVMEIGARPKITDELKKSLPPL